MALVQIRMSGDTLIYAEVDGPEPIKRSKPLVSRLDAERNHLVTPDSTKVQSGRGGLTGSATREIDFQSILSTVKRVARELSGAFEGLELRPDSYEFTFGFKLTAEANVILAKTGGEASFEVKLSWDRRAPDR